MRKRQIDFFFSELDRALGRHAEIILTGAAAGSLMGHVRPSLDLDFEIRPSRSAKMKPAVLEKTLLETARKAGLAVNYSEDISHWNMISFLDYRKKAVLYGRFGRLTVRLMDPATWTIGKITRYYALDALDVAAVIRKQKLKPGPLVGLWKRALGASPMSLQLGQFKEHAAHFLKNHGRRLWGKSFDWQVYARKLE